MNNKKMTPENAVNTGDFLNSAGCDSRNQSVPQLNTLNSIYQCIVCPYSGATPVEMHQHQISVHTTEQLSLSILGLQILYNMNELSKNEILKQINTSSVSNNNLRNQSPKNNNNNNNNESFQISNTNVTFRDSINSNLQEEPMCLKVHNRNSQIAQENNNLMAQQKIVHKTQQLKKPTLSVIQKLVPLNQDINYLQAPSNVLQQPLIWNDGQLYTQKTVPIIKENYNISQIQPTCSQILPNNFLLKSNEIQSQTESPTSVIKNIEQIKRSQTLLKIPKAKFINFKTLANKEEHQFKKPESIPKTSKSIIKKSELILKSKIIIKEPEIITNKVEETFNDSNVIINYCPCLKSGENFNKLSEAVKKETKEIFLKPKMISLKKKVSATNKPKEPKKKKVITEKSKKPKSKKSKVISNKFNQSSNISDKESSKDAEIISNNSEIILQNPEILKNQPTVIINRIDEIHEPKEKVNNVSENKNKLSKIENKNCSNKSYDNFEIVNRKRKRSKSNDLKIVLSRSNNSPESTSSSKSSPKNEETNSKISKLSPNLKSRNRKSKLLLKLSDVPSSSEKSSQIIEVIDDGWDNSVKAKLQVDSELPMDITKLAMQDTRNINDFNNIQNIEENSSCDDLTNEILIQMDPFLTSQLLQEYDFSSQEIDNENIDYQVRSNLINGFNYANEGDVILDLNQPTITSVDLNENVWSDDNLTYAELLPVFQEDNFQDLIN
ncbi:general transcriptional corepressor trfA-like [Leptopilina boulardi]|uniref:general transcriptional corepressor trfA-like n=1 Tax=Leptopilina boulardi TaxID=63433 RepID=UPI0021F61010|nr:general transcriptional corepressor trfA-like [Leptopilina boulardi]